MLNRDNLWVSFWPIWIVANALGWAGASIILLLPYWGLWAALGISLFLSFAQWLVLRSFLGIDHMWLGLSPIPYGAFLFYIFYTAPVIPLTSLLIAGALCLGVLGVAQRFALAYYLDRATIWMIVSPLAGVVALIVAAVLNVDSVVFTWAVFGVGYGAITGIALIYLREYTLKNADRPTYVPPPMSR